MQSIKKNIHAKFSLKIVTTNKVQHFTFPPDFHSLQSLDKRSHTHTHDIMRSRNILTMNIRFVWLSDCACIWIVRFAAIQRFVCYWYKLTANKNVYTGTYTKKKYKNIGCCWRANVSSGCFKRLLLFMFMCATKSFRLDAELLANNTRCWSWETVWQLNHFIFELELWLSYACYMEIGASHQSKTYLFGWDRYEPKE